MPTTSPNLIHEAFHLASTGRPGPVLVDIPKDVLNQITTWREPHLNNLPGYKPTVSGHPMQIRAALDMIEKAERPVLYVGGGVIKAGAAPELLAFAEAVNAPVVTTLMARGAFPDDHPLALGMPGMHGLYTATTAIQKSDVLVSLGARFDDRVTGDPNAFAPDAKIIHVDVDPAEIGKVRTADVPIVGDARSVLNDLLSRSPRPTRGGRFPGPGRLVRPARPVEGPVPPRLRAGPGWPDQGPAFHREALRDHRWRCRGRRRRRPASDVGLPVLGLP